MSHFEEHNNRQKANKFAEYITDEPLRRYVADKVRHYAGESVSIFDGAAGSGQLEQFVQPNRFVAVEIQSEACAVLAKNYPFAEVHHTSFFTYSPESDRLCEAVIMNPPFSLKFKALSEAEQAAIQAQFPWKKSGVVDDIFVLKGLKQVQRWGFFILFPGVGYRNTEKTFRQLIGNQLVEINRIQNAFEDTSIDVLFLVIDKQKTSNTAKRELFDCKTLTLICTDEWQINPDHWEQIRPPVTEKEAVDPHGLELEARRLVKQNAIKGVQLSKMFVTLGEFSTQEFNDFCDDLSGAILNEKFEFPSALLNLENHTDATSSKLNAQKPRTNHPRLGKKPLPPAQGYFDFPI